jgi:hypothetical protein
MKYNMAIQKYPHEIFEEVCKLEKREDRIKYLKENAYKQVKTLLQLCYNDKIVLDLPAGKPPFNPCPEGRQPSPIANVFKPIGLLVKGSKISQLKKEKIFIGMLEQLPEEDAGLLVAAKDGTIINLQNKKYRKITKSLVEATFPELLK